MAVTYINSFLSAGGGGGGGGFVPTDVSGLVLWLRSDAGVYSDAGTTPAVADDPVQQWNDQSGNGNHYTQATLANRPLYKTGVFDGRPAIRFDNTNDWMGGVVVSAPYTVIAAYCQRGSNTTRRALSGSNNWLIGPYSGYHRPYAGQFLVGTTYAVTVGVFAYVEVGWNGLGGGSSVTEVYVSGVNATNSQASNAPGTMYLGGAGAFAEELDGDIVEVLVYNKMISAGERTNLNTWLDERWVTGGWTP